MTSRSRVGQESLPVDPTQKHVSATIAHPATQTPSVNDNRAGLQRFTARWDPNSSVRKMASAGANILAIVLPGRPRASPGAERTTCCSYKTPPPQPPGLTAG